MPFQLTKFDRELASSASLEVVAEPIGGFPLGNGKCPFQFPPRIVSDNKSVNWMYYWTTFAWEPQAIWSGNSARQITLKTEYVCTNHSFNGIVWDTKGVSKVVKNLKSYFYTNAEKAVFPIIKLNVYEQAPARVGGPTTWRGLNISVKPGEDLITINDFTYPLRTEIDLSLELITNIEKDDKEVYNIPELQPTPPQEWY